MKRTIAALLMAALIAMPIQERLAVQYRSAIQCPNCGCFSPNWKRCAAMCTKHVWTDKELSACERTTECKRMMCVR
jgi:hypothetical protein